MSKKKIEYAILCLCYCITVFFYFRLLQSPLFWDDFKIFNNHVIEHARSPLLFWMRGQEETKSWPLFFTASWVLFRFFAHHFIYYYIFNLLLHFTNSFLILQIAKRLKINWPLIPAVIFLFHPMAMEPVSWIFQLSKLLSCFFLLLWLFFSLSTDKKSLIKKFFSLVCALLSGGYAYLITTWEVISHFKKKKWLSVLLFAVTAYFVFLLAVGIGHKDYSDRSMKAYFTLYKEITICSKYIEDGNNNLLSFEKVNKSTEGAINYLLASSGLRTYSPQFTACLYSMRIASVGISTYMYLVRFIAPLNSRIPQSIPALHSWTFVAFLCLGMGILAATIFSFFTSNLLLRSLSLAYLPISGLFFFSWINYSLVDDRLFYVPLAFLILSFWQTIEPYVVKYKISWLILSIWALFLLYEAHNRSIYLDTLHRMPLQCIPCTPNP